ncbi:prepilin peptidase [Corynebacterium pygosceleis]|uniref:Prepilin peptidase n=1 Tax=Corynebacterium pygosceleis TaxID=2800406 RepID=A0A9Q4C781_9CORY|nr:prepilin peptidase [Corynebacterium pygosceleis]MCK7636956.1 prepilin peptidase [Corynebacterium pygosceleis]MCK7674430.1 prepilin peptidase [Corynebacterium pygosceleis]MCL0120272.1 prepilin peptidase [Corynebacterium pygosceleis]MCX7443819.1 prepilin peptidase [Corynebacterium pygosceleis]MCX7467709.1 prepilin peptidase [Corynebacterium pygosceleis]
MIHLLTVPVLAAWVCLLVHHDVRHRRLPDGLTLPPAVSAITVACWFAPGCLLPGLGWFLVYLLVAPASGGGIGGGDMKLAVSLGISVTVTCGFTAGFRAAMFAGVLSAAFLLCTRRDSVPHGPAMFAGSFLVLLPTILSTGPL